VPGATPKEAVEAFLRPWRRVISCVTRSILNVRGGYHPREKPHTVFIGDALPIALPGPARLKLRVTHHNRILRVPDQRDAWKISTAGYF